METLNIVLRYLCLGIEAISISYMIYVISCIICRTIHPNPLKSILLFSIGILCLGIIADIFEFFTAYAWVKSLSTIIILAIIAKIFYKIKILPAFFSVILTMLFAAVIELIIAVIVKLLGLPPELMRTTPIYSCFISLILSFTYFITSYFSFKIYKRKVLKTVDTDKITKYLVPQFIAIAICLIPSMAILMKNNFEYSSIFIIVNIVQISVISLVSIYNIINVVKQKETEQQLENTIIHNKTLTKVNEGVRGFKHDMGNIVQAILGYIALNDQEGAKEFCQNLVIGFNDINVLSILSPKVINDPAIYGVVVNKILIARENNMELSLDISANISKINFPKFELSRILGILIDNAIEAGINTTERKLILNIHTSNDALYDEIIISNSIKNLDIPLDKIFKKDYSSKSNPSGFGLYEVSQILEKYNQGLLTTSIDKDNMLFTQKIKIFK